jgi:hypothetical protein
MLPNTQQQPRSLLRVSVPAILGSKVQETFQIHYQSSIGDCSSLWYVSGKPELLFYCSDLISQGEQDRRFVRTEFYVGAQLLQGTHGYSSGNKRLFELSDSFRSSLVNNARCMGLFQDRPKTVPINDSLDARWHAWISDERLRRLAWAVYVSPSSYTSPVLTISGIRFVSELSTQHSPIPQCF